MSGRRRLLLWRHGQTAQNKGGIFQGHLDSELSEVGLAQARAAAEALASQKPQLLWSSDLRRAASTAAELAALTALEVVHDRRLREIDVGRWQGRSYQELQGEYAEEFAALDRGEDVRRGVDGETVAEVATRTAAAAAELLSSLPEGATAVIVGHGLASRVLAAELVGLDQAVAWQALAGIGNCHWIEVGEQRTGWRITGWNLGGISTQTLISDR